MAIGYLKLFASTSNNDIRSAALSCLDWLVTNKSPFYEEFSWGNQFNYATRTGKRPRLEPIIVWSSIIGQAFMDAYEIFHDQTYVDVARSICRWILALPREQTPTGDCLSYVAYKQVSIHNSNMLGAALLARVGSCDRDATALKVARSAISYTCSRLRPDGSWYYGEHPKYRWIDNFHTGYNLECLKLYMDWTGDGHFSAALNKGLSYFKTNFFEANGCPRYFHNQLYPVDIQSASQAIDTLTLMSEVDSDSLLLARKIAEWTIDNMQAHDGHFIYRILSWKKVNTPMIHWGQATMFKALVALFQKCRVNTKIHCPTRSLAS
jgi:hypothetical protein